MTFVRAESAWMHTTMAHSIRNSIVVACRIPSPNCKWPARSAGPRSQGACLWSSSNRAPSNGGTPYECTPGRVHPAEPTSTWHRLCTPTTIYWQAWNGAAWYALFITQQSVSICEACMKQHCHNSVSKSICALDCEIVEKHCSTAQRAGQQHHIVLFWFARMLFPDSNPPVSCINATDRPEA